MQKVSSARAAFEKTIQMNNEWSNNNDFGAVNTGMYLSNHTRKARKSTRMKMNATRHRGQRGALESCGESVHSCQSEWGTKSGAKTRNGMSSLSMISPKKRPNRNASVATATTSTTMTSREGDEWGAFNTTKADPFAPSKEFNDDDSFGASDAFDFDEGSLGGFDGDCTSFVDASFAGDSSSSFTVNSKLKEVIPNVSGHGQSSSSKSGGEFDFPEEFLLDSSFGMSSQSSLVSEMDDSDFFDADNSRAKELLREKSSDKERDVEENLVKLLKTHGNFGRHERLKELSFNDLRERYTKILSTFLPKRSTDQKDSKAMKALFMEEAEAKIEDFAEICRAWHKHERKEQDRRGVNPTEGDKKAEKGVVKAEESVVKEWGAYADAVEELCDDEDSEAEDLALFIEDARYLSEEAKRRKRKKEKAAKKREVKDYEKQLMNEDKALLEEAKRLRQAAKNKTPKCSRGSDNLRHTIHNDTRKSSENNAVKNAMKLWDKGGECDLVRKCKRTSDKLQRPQGMSKSSNDERRSKHSTRSKSLRESSTGKLDLALSSHQKDKRDDDDKSRKSGGSGKRKNIKKKGDKSPRAGSISVRERLSQYKDSVKKDDPKAKLRSQRSESLRNILQKSDSMRSLQLNESSRSLSDDDGSICGSVCSMSSVVLAPSKKDNGRSRSRTKRKKEEKKEPEPHSEPRQIKLRSSNPRRRSNGRKRKTRRSGKTADVDESERDEDDTTTRGEDGTENGDP